MTILVVYIIFSVLIGALMASIQGSILAGALIAVLWPIGLGISIIEWLKQKLL